MTRKVTTIAVALASIALIASAQFAFGQETVQPVVVEGAHGPTEVVVPVGNWLTLYAGAIRDGIVAAAIPIVLWLIRNLPSNVVAWVTKDRVDQALRMATQFAMDKVVNAFGHTTITVDVRSQIVAEAFNYLVRHTPTLVDKMGGVDLVREKIEARIPQVAADTMPTVVAVPGPASVKI